MDIIETVLIGIGLAMDACAVSICKGLAAGRVRVTQCAVTGVWFGGFQMLMPTIGYFLGRTFADRIDKYDHWIAFILLAWIGGNMVRESLSKEEREEEETGSVSHKELLVLAVATSIDALAVGVTFSMLELAVSIAVAVILIGCTTFVISLAGVYVGNVFGAKYKSKAEFVGGAILILIGVKILLERFGVL